MDSKECNRCRFTKPLTDFSPDKRIKRDGHRATCRVCASAHRKWMRDFDRRALEAVRARGDDDESPSILTPEGYVPEPWGDDPYDS